MNKVKRERGKKEKSRSIYSHCVSDEFPFLSDFYIADLKALSDSVTGTREEAARGSRTGNAAAQ